jgi:RNA polymerase sigma-70 factor (ECF subfamily)
LAAVPSRGRAAGVEAAPPEALATKELYERYAGQVFGFCVNRLGSRDEAEDAVQSTFLNAHRALQRGVVPESELAWLFKIAHNVCLTRRRSWRRRNRVETPSDLDAVQDALPAPQGESSDELIRLTDALEHMPDNQRRAILLREWQGLSYAEIADDLEVSQSAVETLIFRARRALAANLQVEPPRRPAFATIRKAFDVGTLLAALKALFATGAAVKATAAAVAVTGAAVIATSGDAPLPKPTVAVAKQAPSAAVLAAAPNVDVVRAMPAERRARSFEGRAVVPPATLKEKAPNPNAAAAKARRDARALPPGQARKAGVVAKKPHPVKPSRAAVGHAKAAAKPKPVKAKPTRAKAPKPPVANAGGNGNGNGNGNGQGKNG